MPSSPRRIAVLPPAETRASSPSTSHSFAERRSALFRDSDPLDFADAEIEKGGLHAFFRGLRQYPFTDREKLDISKKFPYFIVEGYAKYFQMTSRDGAIDLAVRLVPVATNPVQMCRELGLSEPEDLLAVARQLKGYPLSIFASSVKFEDEKHRFELALRLVETYGANALTTGVLAGIGLSPQHWREAVFTATRHFDQDTMVDFSDSCDFSDIKDQRQFMFLMATSAPGCCVASRGLMAKFDETTRKDLAEAVAQSRPSTLLYHIERFGITDKNVLLSLFRKNFKRGIDEIAGEYFKEYEKSGARVDPTLIIWQIADTCHKVVENFFRKDTSVPNYSKDASELGIAAPYIATLMDAARRQPSTDSSRLLCTWTHYVNLIFSELDIPETARDPLSSTLRAIFSYRKPDARFPLATMLARPLALDDDDNAVDVFIKVSKQLTRAHSLVFRPVVCDLRCQQALDDALQIRLSRALKHTAAKDSARTDRIMNGLLALTQARLDSAEKQRLLDTLVPKTPTKDDIKSFATAMQSLSEFLPLLAQPAWEGRARSKLASVGSEADLKRALGEMMFLVLGRESLVDAGRSCSLEDLMKRLQRYNDRLAEPSPIMGYAIKMFCDLPFEEERKAVLAVINRFVDVTILSDDRQAFVRAKNDLSMSEHLQRAAKIDPEATQRWLTKVIDRTGVFADPQSSSPEDVDVIGYLKQRIVRDAHVAPGTYPIVERVLKAEITVAEAQQSAKATSLRKNEADLLKLLDATLGAAKKVQVLSKLIPELEIKDPSAKEKVERNLVELKKLLTPRRDFSDWRVQFKHDAEAYLGCGNIIGSCQTVYGETRLNKALMGYVMQGKYRMIAVTSPNGALQARCIVRLGVDEDRKKLVMHLEGMYGNPGIPDNCYQVVHDIAKELARDIGVDLVTHQEYGGSGEKYPNTIHFGPDSTVYEYVDSERHGVVDSRKGYALAGARLVDVLA